MNSSTNPPQKNVRKFQFDTDFDLEEERLRVEALRQAERDAAVAPEHEPEPEPEPAPVFSEDQMRYAREEEYQKGYSQGLEEARQSVDNTVAGLVKQMMVQVDALLAAEQENRVRMQHVAIQTVVASIKKLWPSVVARAGLDTVLETVQQALESNAEETRLVIRVHDTMLDPVINRLPEIQEQKAFAGKIIVLSDPAVGTGDCKVEWADGGMERLGRDLSAQLDHAVERILAHLPNPND